MSRQISGRQIPDRRAPGRHPVRRRSRRAFLVVAAALAVVLPLSGCVAWFLPPTAASATSTPTGEDVTAELAPYYHQVLKWTLCGDNQQCTTAKAPLDWSKPAGESIELALTRQTATGGKSMGSLLVNPGGPGASGYDFIQDSVDYATSENLQKSYDIVGFDPRGVEHSTAIKCYTKPAQLDSFIYDIPEGVRGTDAWISEVTKASAQFGEDCLDLTGDLLGNVDTISAAKDMDMLRAALGDDKLNYLGYSYGTLLGATYAELFPKKTGHLVLDGAVDPTVSNFELSATQAKGFESAMRAFLAECGTLKGCPFTGTADESMALIRTLLDRLDASPIRNSDGRELGANTMFTAIIYPLYNVENWPYLVNLFTSVMQGNATVAFTLADAYNDRTSDGTYSSNSTEAFTSINCLDYPVDSKIATMRAQAQELDEIAPTFGHLMSYGGTGCADWPFPPTAQRGPIAAAGSADILVVGTTNDPATPYVWSKSLAGQLENGHLITYKGEGHTAYNKSNACVNNAVDDYFIKDVVPTSDPSC